MGRVFVYSGKFCHYYNLWLAAMCVCVCVSSLCIFRNGFCLAFTCLCASTEQYTCAYTHLIELELNENISLTLMFVTLWILHGINGHLWSFVCFMRGNKKKNTFETKRRRRRRESADRQLNDDDNDHTTVDHINYGPFSLLDDVSVCVCVHGAWTYVVYSVLCSVFCTIKSLVITFLCIK